ncbi:MAG: spermidine/putrescine ABC transporter substrate-binding protein [Microthrixaceae bacterium]|nr:spermidine/putrescine ABC transporter substrate-binding protein [Microthrixaceae bacterium]MCO5313951.1 spermidine/putrescine ABC transporter substrate-binding protein [Microthrixaceae bacterium]
MSNHHHRRPALSRRQFLGRSGIALGGFAIAPSLLAACGSDDTDAGGSGGSSSSQDVKSLYFANWPSYIDEETVGLFEEASGIKFRYTEEFNDNYEYFAKIQPLLSAGKPIEPDLIAPTSWMAGRLISLGWTEKLPFDLIPNAKNLDPQFDTPTWDPTGEFSLPWQAGMAGICFNQAAAGRELHTVEDLWDPAFKGKIGLLTEYRDTLGILGMAMDVDIENPTAANMQPVLDLIQEQVDSGQVGRFHGNDYLDDLATGNLVACLGWSGDIAQLALDNPDCKFVIPESGATLWADAMIVPKGADGIEAAAKFMDFVYDPVNAARIAEYVQFISPVQGVKEELERKGGEAAELAANPLMFPTDADKANLRSFGNLSDSDEEALDAAFSKLQGN